MAKFLFGNSWSNVEVVAAMMIAGSSLGFWSSLGIFLLVVIGNGLMQSVFGVTE